MAPTMEEMERLLAESKAATQRALALADQERHEKEQERREKEKVQRLIRATTLEEYLRGCQEHVLSKIVLVTDGYLTSRAPVTNPSKKHCPCRLAKWDDFLAVQAAQIQEIDRIAPNERLFESVHFLQTIGDRIHARHVTGESSLVFVENNCIEDPVRIILSKLKDFQNEQHALSIPDQGVEFQTTASSLRDPDDNRDTVQRDERLRTDQICVFRNKSDQKDIAFVIEYKAPHRLHTSHFEKGLREMDIVDEVVNKPTIPTTDPEKFTHYAELLTTAALTQTYHYMLEAGLEYGYLTNGDAIVFLHIDWRNPTVLLYHLARPAGEVVADKDPTYSNAVCQVLAFTVLALQAPQHSNNERITAAQQCRTWEVDFGCILDKILKEEEEQEKEAAKRAGTPPSTKKHRRVPSSPDWLPLPYKKARRNPHEDEEEEEQDKSDRVLRSQHRRDDTDGDAGGASSGPSSERPGQSGPSSGSSGQPGQSGQSGPSRQPGQSTMQGRSYRSHNGPCSDPNRGGLRPYCTTRCLLSLVKGQPLDSACPNVALHRNADADTADSVSHPTPHPLSLAQWTDRLCAQLKQGLDGGVVRLLKEGACGALFQVTLLQYGYTFIAKGVTNRNVPKLQKEEAVYERLQPLQGRHIPVCLGSVDLRLLGQMFFYDLDVRIIYFLLLSHAGSEIRLPSHDRSEQEARIAHTVARVVDEMHRLGVIHGDVRLPNVLQGPDGEITLVDFDQASLLPPAAYRPPSAISPRKRRRLLDNDEAGTPSKKNTAAARVGMKLDSMNARTLFYMDLDRPIRGACQT